MRYPWANTLLLVLVCAELTTGMLGLMTGTPDLAEFMLAHRVLGYSLMAVIAWKAAIILQALRRPRANSTRSASVVLLAILVVTLSLGLAWSLAGPFFFAGFSGLSWHAYVGAQLVPLMAWHALKYTRGFPLAFWADRRTFLRFASGSIAGFVLWQAVEAPVNFLRSGTRKRFTGSYEDDPGESKFPVVSWLNDRTPSIDADRWRLAVSGAVRHERSLGYADISPDVTLTATIDCTGGWYSTQEWRGMPVSRILDAASPLPSARSVTFTSATGYYRRFSLDEARHFLLATHVSGEPLSPGHGFPVRLVAPGKRGFEWVKWVVRIDVNESSRWLQPPLPLQ
ncbi:MAG: sulfite oxidase [SAR202 cluster bacterium]|nr:sulfite oxidase [SAR202 cluster bacterium]